MKKLLLIIAMSCLAFNYAEAQENITYQVPPAEIMQLADYQRPPSVFMDQKKENMVYTYRNTYKTLDDLNQDELRLGGIRINPNTNISASATFVNNIKLGKVAGGDLVQVTGLPKNPRISNFRWSDDYKHLSFTNTVSNGNELWIVEIATAKATKLTDAVLNANLGNPVIWVSNTEMLVRVFPKNRKALIDTKKAIPTGPIVSTADGTVSQNRTYQDMLKNKIDEQNFENITTSEIWKINISGKKDMLFPANMYLGYTLSPNRQYLLVSTMQHPFSYIVPFRRFPSKTEVYDMNGKLVKLINEKPLLEVLPKGFMAEQKGMRSFSWRADKPATLTYVVALDDGDPAKQVEKRDEVFSWDAPFTSAPVSLFKTKNRYAGIIWGDDNHAIVYDNWFDTRMSGTYLFNPSKPGEGLKLIVERNYQDVYSDPGNFETRENEFGYNVLAIEKGKAFLIGDGHTPKGQFPFIDEFDLKKLTTKRLYQSKYTDKIESISSITDYKKMIALVNIQSAKDYPNYYLRELKKDEKITQVTHFENPFKALGNVHKEVIKYKRKDGLELSGTLYLPAGYDKDKKEKLPLLIWAYPEEFKDRASAGQVKANPNEFTYPYYGSFVYWVTRGYAVLDDASFPIVGEGKEEPNDTFIEQLVANAEAAIDAVDKLGYIDRKRVGVGGHSYGAFMTANLLSHSNLFACGIARSGAYNRTLTPFGFQMEQRNFWDAPEIYNTMSPFMSAHKMKTPMLLVHGDADNNPGTFTLQTERYFQALKGLGAPVKMLLLPKESHGYVAKENIFHLLWEQDQFLEKYLKNKK